MGTPRWSSEKEKFMDSVNTDLENYDKACEKADLELQEADKEALEAMQDAFQSIENIYSDVGTFLSFERLILDTFTKAYKDYTFMPKKIKSNQAELILRDIKTITDAYKENKCSGSKKEMMHLKSN